MLSFTRLSRINWRGVSGWHIRLVAVLTLSMLALSGVGMALAQTDSFPTGAVVRVANTDGQRLNLRAGPSTSESVVARLEPGTRLTVTGPSRTGEGMRWLAVRTDNGGAGWVSAQYVELVSAPTPTPTPVPTVAPTPTPTPPPSASEDESTSEVGEALTVEAKLKYPELDGREQEITVWVTRNGEPVPDVIVTLETEDGDDEEHFRELDPTNEEGWTRRSFDVRHEKGTVRLKVQAVAPDGGEGQVIVSYFRR